MVLVPCRHKDRVCDDESILKSGLFRMSRGQKVESLEDTARGDIRKDRERGQNDV